MIEKCGKNEIKWKGTLNIPDDTELDYEIIRSKKELKVLQDEERELNNCIEVLQESFNKIASSTSYSELAYLTYDDLSKLGGSKQYKGQKLIVIKAPPNSVMEVPDPEEVETYFKEVRKKADEHDKEAEEVLTQEKEIEDKKYQLNMTSKTSEIMIYTVENEENENQSSPRPDAENNEPCHAGNLSSMYAK